ARTLSERQDAVFIMAGDGPLRGRVQQEIERYGLQARTRLLGVREDIPDLLAVSHLLLLTSRTEGMPASVIEAGLMGVPVVAPCIGGIPEAVLDGISGLLAPPGDTKALSDRISALLNDHEMRARMGQAGRARALSMYDIRTVADMYVSLFRAIARTN